MAAMKKNLDDQLQDLIDGTLSAEEQKELMKELSHNASAKAKYEELERAHKMFASMVPEEPSAHFVDKVMQGLNRREIKPAFNFKAMILALGVLICVGITALLLLETPTTQIEIPSQIQVMDTSIPTSEFMEGIDLKLIFNGILFVGFLLGMLLLDRALLRPMFHRTHGSH